MMPPQEHVHLVFDCDDTLVNTSDQTTGHTTQTLLSPHLVDLCIHFLKQGRLSSITINTHQDIETIRGKLTGLDGFLDYPPIKTISWHVAEALKKAISEQVEGADIPIQVCLQSDLYPPLEATKPHKLGDTAMLLSGAEALLVDETDAIKHGIGEQMYQRCGMSEPHKKIQTAFVLDHLVPLPSPDDIHYVLYFDDTLANLVEKNLPTDAWLRAQILADTVALTTLTDESEMKRSLQNRLSILQFAAAIDDPTICFESFHYVHKQFSRKKEDPEAGRFHLIYSSRGLEGRAMRNCSVVDIMGAYPVTTYPPQLRATGGHVARALPVSAVPVLGSFVHPTDPEHNPEHEPTPQEPLVSDQTRFFSATQNPGNAPSTTPAPMSLNFIA
ncbi:MAG: hypothetical protein NTW08_08920 [Gammaproteobacteria bacterium]|nr:hypothetical protein [Gammaproteobacteria bacterium]